VNRLGIAVAGGQRLAPATKVETMGASDLRVSSFLMPRQTSEPGVRVTAERETRPQPEMPSARGRC